MHTHPLKYAREARGWSQHEVANKIGVSGRTVARWEQGRSLPYPYYREQLCQLFHLDASSLGLLPQEKTPPSSPDSQMMDTPTPTSQIRTQALFDPIIPEALGTANSLLGRDALLNQLKTYLLNDNSSRLPPCKACPASEKHHWPLPWHMINKYSLTFPMAFYGLAWDLNPICKTFLPAGAACSISRPPISRTQQTFWPGLRPFAQLSAPVDSCSLSTMPGRRKALWHCMSEAHTAPISSQRACRRWPSPSHNKKLCSSQN
jgi:transcriptional regulator with XRE-family HTH domain